MLKQIEELLLKTQIKIEVENDPLSGKTSYQISFDMSNPKNLLGVSKDELTEAKETIKEIVKASGIPEKNVVVASVPKQEQAPKLIEVEPELTPKEKKAKERYEKRKQQLEDIGFHLIEKEKQFSQGGIGIGVALVKLSSDTEWNKSYAQVKERLTKPDVVARLEGKMETKGKATGTLTFSEEEKEMIEDMYKGKPATIDEAFEAPEPITEPEVTEAPIPPEPPVPIEDEMKFIAKNPIEQMKKNNGKPYLNKKDDLIMPENDSNNLKELWSKLMDKCKANDISTEGLTLEEQTATSIKELDAMVDEAIEENNQ